LPRRRQPDVAEELFNKFENCAAAALAHEPIAPLFERLGTLETVPTSAR